MKHVLKPLGLTLHQMERSIFSANYKSEIWGITLREIYSKDITWAMPRSEVLMLLTEHEWKEYSEYYAVISDNQLIIYNDSPPEPKPGFGGSKPKNPFAKEKPWKKNYK